MKSIYMSKISLRNIDKQSQTDLPNGVPLVVDGWTDDSHESIRMIYEYAENATDGGKQKRRRNNDFDRGRSSDSEELLLK